MARALEKALDVDAAVPERGLRLARRGLERALNFLRAANDPHPLSAASRRRLQNHRKAHRPGRPARLPCGLERHIGPRDDRHPRRRHPPAGLRLVAHRTDRCGRGADEEQSRPGHGLREVATLGQEAVARVHGLGPAAPGRVEESIRRQIALGGPGGADRVRSSACSTCGEVRSASEKTAMVRIPISFAPRITRSAISPRLATSTLSINGLSGAPVPRAERVGVQPGVSPGPGCVRRWRLKRLRVT